MDDQFHKVFQKIYNKQDVDDSSEAIKECLDSCGDIKPSKYLKSKALIDKKKKRNERWNHSQQAAICTIQEN